MEQTKNLYARVNAILTKCADINILVSPLKLQKLLYLNYYTYLKQGGNELPYLKFEPWTYGPVVSKVYQYYKNYGSNFIKEQMKYNNVYPILLDDDSIESTALLYAKLQDFKLVAITHKQGGAWEKAFRSNSEFIDHKDIRND